MTEQVEVVLVDAEDATETPVVTKTKRQKKLSLSEVVRQRFSDAVWSKQRWITVGGAGGIGSNVLYVLIKHGHNILLYEYDIVENHNIGGQMFNILDVGMAKTSAIQNMATYINPDVHIAGAGKLLPTSSVVYPITISCFDNMAARKLLFDLWCKQYSDGKTPDAIFIDSRMGAEYLEVYAVTPDKIERYAETLFDDSVVEDLSCNFKATTQTGLLIAGMVIGCMTNHIYNYEMKEDIREVPFKVEFNIPMMYYESTI